MICDRILSCQAESDDSASVLKIHLDFYVDHLKVLMSRVLKIEVTAFGVVVLLCSDPHFGHICVTKADYDEQGTCRLASSFY